MKIRGGLGERIAKMFGIRMGLRGNFGRLPERRRFELRPDQIARVTMKVAAAKEFESVMGPMVGPRHIQFQANAVWYAIAKEHGVDVRSIRPDEEKGFPYFTAVPLPDDERNAGGILVDVVGPK
jgi:hypothetical protein